MVLRSLKSFGRVDAETDIGLADFFIETPSYRDIENGERLLVVGRKGTGKTAIYRTLLRNAKARWEDFFAVGLDFRNYPWDLHEAASATGSPSPERYAPLWQFLILVELSKLILRGEPRRAGRDARRARRQLKRFVKRNWGGTDASVRQMFNRSSYKLTLEPRALGFSLGSLMREKVPRERLADSLGSVNQWLEQQLAAVVDRDASYFVLLDDLDGDFRAEDDAACNRLSGLLHAARLIRIWTLEEGLPFTPVIFMRSDIYAALRLPSRNKIRSEDLEGIAWSEREGDPASLKTLIAQRIEASVDYRCEDPWHEVFSEESLDGRPLYELMAAHTHLRPRDMIHLANLSLECAKQAGASHIGAAHVEAALPEYSEYLLEELVDAAHQSVEDWDEHVMTLRRLGARRFCRDAFAEAHSKGSSEASVDHALGDLYEFGGIGYLQGESTVFAHSSEISLDSGATRFEVHRGLWPVLGLATRPEGETGGDTDRA